MNGQGLSDVSARIDLSYILFLNKSITKRDMQIICSIMLIMVSYLISYLKEVSLAILLDYLCTGMLTKLCVLNEEEYTLKPSKSLTGSDKVVFCHHFSLMFM